MKDPLRVAMLIHNYLPPIGGAERQLAAVAPLLQQQNVELHVLTRHRPGLAPFEIIDGVSIYRLAAPGPKVTASLGFTLAGLRLLRRLQPDILHAHDLLSPTLTAVIAKQMLHVPVVAKVLRGGSLGDITKLKRMKLGPQRLRLFREQVDAFVVISQEIDEELAEIGVPATRRHFIPNGVDTARFAPQAGEARRAQRAALGLPDSPIAIFTGRLEKEKRLDLLIDIWPAVRAAHPGALLLVLGEGSEAARLKQAAGEGVRFLGVVEDVAPYLQAADLFVLPSATEGLSNSLLEALSAGLAAVATDVGGAPDLIVPGESGWLVAPDRPALLQEAIVALFGDDERRATMGRLGREKILADYALPVTAGRLRGLYERLAMGERQQVSDSLALGADR